MKKALDKFYEFIDRPLNGWVRLVLAVSVVFLVLAFTQPLWRISMEAPQYPQGLWMDISAYKLEGGNDGQHITEINTLNHYIGMHSIDRTALDDLDWIPFALGALVLFALRVAAVGNVRSLLDLAVVTSYVSLFAFGRFIYRLYVFGHNLDPKAPVQVEPFMPVVFGTKQIANFTTHSMPRLGSLYMGIFALAVLGSAAWVLIKGRMDAVRRERAEKAAALAAASAA